MFMKGVDWKDEQKRAGLAYGLDGPSDGQNLYGYVVVLDIQLEFWGLLYDYIHVLQDNTRFTHQLYIKLLISILDIHI